MSLKWLVLASLLFAIPQWSIALCVKKDAVNLRAAPTTKSKITWKVRKYTPLKRLHTKGKWYQVSDIDGQRHWIYKSLVTGTYACGSVKATVANIRTGPGRKFANFEEEPQAEKYASFIILKTASKWLYVQDEFGSKYWIARSLVWIQ